MVNKLYPTKENPLFLRVFYDGKTIPSMKNKRTPFIGTSKTGKKFIGTRKSNDVAEFEKTVDPLLNLQWEAQGFDTILLPHRVCIYVILVKWVAKLSTVPLSDQDNQYTTVQEALQGRVPVFENDRQVAAHLVDELLTTIKTAQQAQVWVWLDDGSPRFEQFAVIQKKIEEGRRLINGDTPTVDSRYDLPFELE